MTIVCLWDVGIKVPFPLAKGQSCIHHAPWMEGSGGEGGKTERRRVEGMNRSDMNFIPPQRARVSSEARYY